MALTGSITPSDISYMLQIISLILLGVGIKKLKESVSKHGAIINISFVILMITVVFMLFSTFNVINFWLQGFDLPPHIILVPFHGLLGSVTVILGFLFVMNKWNWKTKKYMRIESAFWFFSFIGGTLMYAIGSGVIIL